jgi:N utilization substance protein B
MTRSQAREQAFLILFENIFNSDALEIFQTKTTDLYEYDDNAFCKSIVDGVLENIAAIDDIITVNLKGWNINRISKVSLIVLRIAVFEMCFYNDTPDSVAINEAVELTKKYSLDKDPSFVNGVLSSVFKGKDQDE